MVVKIYISGISGNKEVKKRQQRVLMILDSKNIKYDVIDITEPGRESDKDFMQNNAKSNGGTVSDPNPRSPLPPQMFNDEEYCGDYDQFDLANEVDTLEQFLKVEPPPEEPVQAEADKEKAVNGDSASKENSPDKETTEVEKTQEENPASEESHTKEATPPKEDNAVASKEPTPAREEKESSPKEKSPEKETTPERQKSVEKEAVPEKEESLVEEAEVEPKHASKENTPVKESVTENGTASSREQSEEKEEVGEEAEAVESKKDNPSELLIQSEQASAAE